MPHHTGPHLLYGALGDARQFLKQPTLQGHSTIVCLYPSVWVKRWPLVPNYMWLPTAG